MPALEEQPPGIDVETEQEGLVAPRDHAIAADDDPAYATTAAEERTPETVLDRAAREEPDVGAGELGVGGGVQGAEGRHEPVVEPGDDVDGDPEEGDGGYVVGSFSAGADDPEDAVRVDEPEWEPVEDEVVGGPASLPDGQLVEPDSAEPGAEEIPTLSDEEADLAAVGPEDTESALSPEEAAMEVRDDDALG